MLALLTACGAGQVGGGGATGSTAPSDASPASPGVVNSGQGGQEAAAPGNDQLALLRLGMLADPDTLNPLTSIDGNAGHWFSAMSYPPLLLPDQNANPLPNLAERYEVSDDGLDVTFYLRGDLAWSDGVPFTSADVAYTKYLAGDLRLSNVLTTPLEAVEEVRTPDPRTVIFHLKSPTYTFVTAIGLRLPIVPKHIWEKMDDPKSFLNEEDPVVMGPYRLREFRRGEYYRFDLIKDNWPAAPDGARPAKELLFRVYPDVNGLSLALQSGEIDLTARDIPYDIALQLEQKGYGLTQNISLGFTHIGFQLENRFLADPTLRRAIAESLDKQTILDFSMKGQGDVMDSIIAPIYRDYQGSDPAAKYPGLDPEKARAELAAAGYQDTDGDGILNAPGSGDNVSFNMLLTANDNAQVNGAEIIARNLRDVGINLEITPLERTTYISRRLSRDFDSYLGSWGYMQAPQGDFVINYDATSPVYFHAVEQPATAAAVRHMRSAVSEADLKDSIREFEIAMAADCMAIPLYAPRFFYAYDPKAIDNVRAYPSMVYGVMRGVLGITPAR
ncbi:MAG: ABC transporter substrate-binding protein [Peptococcaceae bacterium]|nr:ABC transporter substrate-binding protein [Peptococcaceae bacterium]